MSANLSQLDIFNMAVDLIHDKAMTTPNDPGKTGAAFRRNWGVTRDALLRAHPWNFATVRAQLAAGVTAPMSAWDYYYPLPPNCLRIFDLQENAGFEGETLIYAVENDGADQLMIATNKSAPLYVKYTWRVENIGIYDPMFCKALAAALAAACCLSLAGKASHWERINKAYTDALTEARLIDAAEGTPERAISDEWENARLAGW